MMIHKADRSVHHLRQIRPRNRLVPAHIRQNPRDDRVFHFIDRALHHLSSGEGALTGLSVRYVDAPVLISVRHEEFLLGKPIDLPIKPRSIADVDHVRRWLREKRDGLQFSVAVHIVHGRVFLLDGRL